MDSLNGTATVSNYTELLQTNILLPFSIYVQNEIINPSESDINRCDSDNLDEFNCTANEFLLYERGGDVASYWFTIPVTILDVLILLAGILGNAVVVIKHKSLHTNTNFYLFNLAISDLLYLSFGLPFEIHMFWHQYPWLFGSTFCQLRSLVTEACSYASVLTIVAFSVERYVAICHPLISYVTTTNLRRVGNVIAIIWVVSFISASPFAYHREVQFLYYPPPDGEVLPQSAICTSRTTLGLYEASICIFFFMPLIVLSFVCTRIAFKLHDRHTNERLGKFSNDVSSKQLKSTKNIVRMLVIIVIVFFISWAPFHTQRLVFHYGKEWPTYILINEFLFAFGGFFYYLSCAINPIIYNVLSKRYRVAFRQIFFTKIVNRHTTDTSATSK